MVPTGAFRLRHNSPCVVPAYLPAVPRDYFDGEAIKYSRDLRAIWSVGEQKFNLTEPDQAVHERELILPLCFDGSYVPWPRRDPADRDYFSGSEAELTPPEPPAHAAPAAP